MGAMWYFRRDGATHGPYTAKQLKDAARSGAISPDTEIRQADSPQWHPAIKVAGLEFGVPPEAREEIEQFADSMLSAEPSAVPNPLPPPAQPIWQTDDDDDGASVSGDSEYEDEEDDGDDDEERIPQYGFILNLARATEVFATIIAAIAVVAIIGVYFLSLMTLQKISGEWSWVPFFSVTAHAGMSIGITFFVWLFYVAAAQLMRLSVQSARDARRTRIAIERLARMERR